MKGLKIIACFKFVKAAVMILLTVGAFKLIDKDLEVLAEQLMGIVRMDPDGKYFRMILNLVAGLDNHKLELISVSAFFYALVLTVEGFGLWFEKKWAEWFTIAATSLFIPVEIYEVAVRADWKRIVILVINIAIVTYLARNLKRRK